jgi:hypothetical protein
MMKRILLFSLVLLSAHVGFSQCSELFFSEYVEGWSNNKALEVYNPTNDTIDLYNYQIQRWSNGNDIPNPLYMRRIADNPNTVMLAPKDVIVLVIDKRDTAGQGNEAPVWFTLQQKADLFLCPDYNTNRTLYHNGNDAITLEREVDANAGSWSNRWEVVDIFGEIGFNPGEPVDGAGWNDNSANNYYTPDTTVPAWSTNHTLYRKATVREGVTTNPSPFMVSMQWDSMPVNTFDSLGTHTCDCKDFNSINDFEFDANTQLFPSLVTAGKFRIISESRVQEVRVINLLGAEVKSLRTDAQNVLVETGELPFGTYIVHVALSNGKNYVQKIQVQ